MTTIDELKELGIDTDKLVLRPFNPWRSQVLACGQKGCKGKLACPLCLSSVMTGERGDRPKSFTLTEEVPKSPTKKSAE